MAERAETILLVGHCIPDAYALRSALTSLIPGARVEFAPDQVAMEKGLSAARVLLINRALDGEFDTEDGVELIRTLAARGTGIPRMILVSNLAEAQAAAVAAGALPGFGKRGLYDAQTRERVQAGLK